MRPQADIIKYAKKLSKEKKIKCEVITAKRGHGKLLFTNKNDGRSQFIVLSTSPGNGKPVMIEKQKIKKIVNDICREIL